MIATHVSRLLDRVRAGLPDGHTALRLGATAFAGLIAIWAIGLAVSLLLAVLAGAVALAAAIAVVGFAGALLVRHRPALVSAAAGDILGARAQAPGR